MEPGSNVIFKIPLRCFNRISNSTQTNDDVSIFLLSKIKEEFPNISGSLYGDDAFFAISGSSLQAIDRIRKRLIISLKYFFITYYLYILFENMTKCCVLFFGRNVKCSQWLIFSLP